MLLHSTHSQSDTITYLWPDPVALSALFITLRAPFMCAYLLDALLLGVQQRGLATLVAAYSPLPLPLEFVAMQLGFEGPTEVSRRAHFS